MQNPSSSMRIAIHYARFLLVVILPAVVLAIYVPQAASADLRYPSSRDTLVKKFTTCDFSGWSALPPGQCASSASLESHFGGNLVPQLRGNGAGCSGFFVSPDNIMNCENTSITRNGYRVGIRQGYYNPEASPVGFGWTKALELHNLWIQPMIDAIAGAFPQGSDTNRNYEIYHYTDGVFDQAVLVVADIEDTEFDGISTEDGHPVGVITGYCLNDILAEEQDCPDWVDTTL